MLERAHAAGVPFTWVTADSVYGADYRLRRWLQEQKLGSAYPVGSAAATCCVCGPFGCSCHGST